MKVLHILYQSLPQISGSSIRSRDILMSQKEIGLDPIAITSPFQGSKLEEETINGIRYIRTSRFLADSISDNRKPFFRRISRFFKIFSFYRDLKRTVTNENPDILHAHAMFFCGLPAIILGKKFGLGVVYEIRSLWMLKKDKGKGGPISGFIEKILFSIELYVMKRADIVVAINENLKDELIRNGILRNKIRVVGNAVNTTFISELRKTIEDYPKQRASLTFGYIGTLTSHEGIDLLISAFGALQMHYPEATLLIYGNGIEAEAIKILSEGQKNVEFLGPIQPKDVHKAFNNIDIIVNPRYKTKLTDSVTPLKPLEAMAYEKIVIGSDVGGIKELISDTKTGFLFKAGNKDDLVRKMLIVLGLDDEQKDKILGRALSYVTNKKSWIQNAYKYEGLYKSINGEG